MGCNSTSRLCWVFVLVAAVVVVVVPCDARPHKCEQRERSIADLDLAEDSLNRAKQLYPDCEEENERSNSSECSKKDKSLGFIDVALDLVSNAKKNIPLCPHIPTDEPSTTTEETTQDVTTQDFRPMDCQDLLAAGHVTSGVYSVWLQGGESAVRVRCDMDTDGGGWTVIQRRGNFGTQEDFNRNWQDYKHGFGSLERDFWLGNDNIFALTNQGNYSLRMDMTAADSAYALYREFNIEDENANYRLHLGGYSGTAGSSMGNFNFEMFSTKDRNNTKVDSVNCAEVRKGGFWYYYCDVGTDCNPNGLYNPGVEGRSSMYYWGFKGFAGLTSFDMKLRRRG